MKTPLTPDQLQSRRKTNKKILTYGCLPIFIILAVITIFGMIYDHSKENKDKEVTEIAKPEDHSTMAYITSQGFVKQSMNFPEEADFDSTPKYCKNEGDNDYRIVGSVVGKNGFGVKIRQTFKCVLHYNGGDENEDSSWEIVEPVSFE
jgi:hypothetical protein